MSKEKTAPKVTKSAKKQTQPRKGRAKKAASRTGSKVTYPQGSGKSSSPIHILAAALAEPLGAAIEEIADEEKTIDLVLTSRGGLRTVVETKRPQGGRGRALDEISPMSIEGITFELIPDWDGDQLRYELIRHDPEPLRASTSQLADRMLPYAAIPTPAQALLAREESKQRWSLLQEFGALTSEEIADHRSRAKNRHAIANRWRSEDKIFSVEVRGRRLFPGFQFDGESFAPEPLVAQVLAILPRAEMSEWETALWWVAADPHLHGRRPVDLMHEDPEGVVEAAAALARPIAL
jgi:hypothetical protein